MLVNQVLADRVFIICGKTDMRKAINGLAEIVQNQYNLNPYESAAFLFCGRKADRMKCLYWDGNGFLLLYKRLENGQYQWPKTAHEVRSSSDGFWKGWPSTSPKRLGKFIQHESIKFVILVKSAKKPYIYWLYGTFCGILSV